MSDFNFERRRKTVKIQGNTLHLLEPVDADWQKYHQFNIDEPSNSKAIISGRVRLIAMFLVDEQGNNLVAADKLTLIEIEQWPIHVTSKIQQVCLELAGMSDEEGEEGEPGEPTTG